MRMEKTAERLLAQFQAHPGMQIRDIFKFLYQSAFGCEHMVASPEGAIHYLQREYETMDRQIGREIEPLDGDYSRVPLSWLDSGASAETLGKLFFLSAKKEPNGREELLRKLAAARQLVAEGRLPFSLADFEAAAAAWEADGYPAVHHSDAFRAAYKPAYRLIAGEFLPFLALFAELDRRLAKGPVKLAIEGGSASGKTTLSGLLEQVYGCTVFHMDDFFLRPEQRTPERFAEAGGNIDWERFLAQVLEPLRAGQPICYQRFDCSAMALGEWVSAEPHRLVVTEGAYSMRPGLGEHYDLSVFLDICPERQRERITRRNAPGLAKRFFAEWIPMEQRYFAEWDIPARCDMQIRID